MNILTMQSIARPLAGAVILAAGLVASASSQAEESRFHVSYPAYVQECGSCHVAYPPAMLSAASWRAVMGGLDRHFGTDASVDDKTRAQITRFLEANAGRRSTTDPAGKPLLRLTETRSFIHEHTEELPRNIWKDPAVKTAANCQACHTAAEKGDYSERSLRLPKGVRK